MDAEVVDGVVRLVSTPDPYLQYQPAFAYTLPIQLLVNGITFTLLCVLLIHLLFTTQYHYPLAPLNYILQLLSILVVLISVIIKIIVILQHSAHSADTWPYDLDYVAVSIPPRSWNTGQSAAWFLLQALNNGLSNITHIQFLTMLYPSRTEARLIMFVLGPLAIASSALVFSALSPHQTVLDISDAIRNVFNSTLLLIFTISLVIWGFFVNRRRAWRFDGGTAVFGFGSLFLAAVSTSFNFVAVAEDGIDWLQHLLFAAVLWQVWLGWWWWVGSGMGIGEVEDIMERAERKKRKQAKAASRARAANGLTRPDFASTRLRGTSLSGIADNISTGVTSILRHSRAAGGTLTRRNTARDGDEHLAESGAIEMDDLERARARRPQASAPSQPQPPVQQHVEFDRSATMGTGEESGSRGRGGATTTSETSSTSATPSLHPPRTLGQLISFPTTLLVIYLRRLRKAHEEATKHQALARAERRQRVFDGGPMAVPSNAARFEMSLGGDAEVGWGLGRFGIKEHEESAKRLRAAGERLNEGKLLNAEGGANDAGDQQGGSSTPLVLEDDRGEGPSTSPAALAEASEETAIETQGSASASLPAAGATHTVQEEDTQWEDIDSSNSSSNDTRARRGARRRGPSAEHNAEGDATGRATDRRRAGGSGWSWWGPLRDWRLNDRSVY
ncbi:hypothetical protein IAU60_006489 [Kwoniella sp. DSM 27419]